MAYQLKTYLADKRNYGSKRTTSKIKYLVLHYTANDGDTDESESRFFRNNVPKTSAHYFVDDDSVTQSVPDNYVAWSVGGSKYTNCKSTGGGSMYKVITNTNSISIEICDTIRDGSYNFSAKTKENLLAFCKVIMLKYGIDINHVYRHFDVTGKSCPAYWASANNEGWKNFLSRIVNIAPTPTKEDEVRFIYQGVDYSLVFNPEYYALHNADLAKAFGNDVKALFNHFCLVGMAEGRQACAHFNPTKYMNRYNDLKEAFKLNMPMYYLHYCTAGIKEGRTGV
jgi:N-acetyl-anhydromuramyl-L-alanine amidase AmpD